MRLHRTVSPLFSRPMPYKDACTRYCWLGPCALTLVSVVLPTIFQSMVLPVLRSYRSMLPLTS